MKISKIFLYDEPNAPEIKTDELAKFIRNETGIDVNVRDSFSDHFKMDREHLYELTACRITNIYSPLERHIPINNELVCEERVKKESNESRRFELYDGFELQRVFKKILPDSEISEDIFHLVFTTKLVCTYDYEDYRYHGRAVICSNPSIVSTTGIIEAPAKPREYYLKAYEYMIQGLDFKAVRDEFKEGFLEHRDNRLGLVVRGYAMQAIFYYLTGEPFCKSKNCMLYNAHWQEELLRSQLKVGKLCDQHKKNLEMLKKL